MIKALTYIVYLKILNKKYGMLYTQMYKPHTFSVVNDFHT